jgi:hypothetical protein
VIETVHPERGEVLFDRTACLGGDQLDGASYLVGLDLPEGIRVARWEPRWSGEDLAEGVRSTRRRSSSAWTTVSTRPGRGRRPASSWL